MKKFILITLIILVILSILAFLSYKRALRPYKGYPGSLKIEIKSGSSISAITDLLYEKKIIRDKFIFKLYRRLSYPDVTFQAGEFLFSEPLNMKQVIEKLAKGQVVLYKVTVKEGLTAGEIAACFHRQRNIPVTEFRKECKNTALVRDIDPLARDLEGYLFPDTYLVRKGISAGETVRMMVEKFKDNFSSKFKWQAKEKKFTIREIVILASLIEKETSLRSERFLISSVFHNRLRIGMALGCDPTIIYALMRDNKYQGKLGWEELKYDSPYNTRLYRGLPPGPICNPGFDSIEAALYPEKSSYLFFVAKDDHSHYFSKTLREHNKAVKKYIINKK